MSDLGSDAGEAPDLHAAVRQRIPACGGAGARPQSGSITACWACRGRLDRRTYLGCPGAVRGSPLPAGRVDSVRRSVRHPVGSVVGPTGISTSWRLPLVPSMMVMVLLGGTTTGALRSCRRNGHTLGRREPDDAQVGVARGAGGAARPRSGYERHHGLAAEWLVDQDHPAGEDRQREAQDPGDRCVRQVDRSRRPRGLFWPSGALRSSAITVRTPRIPG